VWYLETKMFALNDSEISEQVHLVLCSIFTLCFQATSGQNILPCYITGGLDVEYIKVKLRRQTLFNVQLTSNTSFIFAQKWLLLSFFFFVHTL